MTDSITEKLVLCVQRINEAVLETSENTILSGPGLKNVSPSTKALWLAEDGIIDAFRHSFEKFQVNEKRKAIDSGEMPKTADKIRITVADKLIEQKALVEKEIGKVLENQSLVESTISSVFERLDITAFNKEESI